MTNNNIDDEFFDADGIENLFFFIQIEFDQINRKEVVRFFKKKSTR